MRESGIIDLGDPYPDSALSFWEAFKEGDAILTSLGTKIVHYEADGTITLLEPEAHGR